MLKALPDIDKDKVDKIADAAARSIEASMTDWDLDRIKALAKLLPRPTGP
ncbi:MAG: hypothetical protein ACP5IE_03805 [Infirmifilum sp.]